MLDIKEVEEMAVDYLKKTKGHQTQLIFEKDNKIGMVVLQFTDNTKAKAREEARVLIHRFKLDYYFFVTEGWISMTNKEKLGSMPSIRPSRSVDRKEVLVICEFRKDRKNKSVMRIFERDKDDNPVFVKREAIDGSDSMGGSLWDFFLEKEGVEESIDKTMYATNERFFKREAKLMSEKFKDRFANLMTGKLSEEQQKQLAKEMNDYMETRKQRVQKKMLEDVPDDNL